MILLEYDIYHDVDVYEMYYIYIYTEVERKKF